jgi:predicted esterase
MMINPHQINFQFKARYFTSGILNKNTRYIWLVFHGYGQLAGYFIRKFQNLDDTHYVIAPEGLSRFYLSDNSGRVGASWMTNEDRLTDIENQIAYINKIYQSVQPNIKRGAKLIVLGFSQGTATAMRWIVNQSITPDKLLLWAGTIPPDLDAENKNVDLSGIDTYIVQGDTDPYLETVYMENMRDWLEFYKIKQKDIKFPGGHTIDVETLKQLAASF